MDWLIVGLGNPGPKYAGTRHNVGFDVVDQFADRFGLMPMGSKNSAILRSGRVIGQKVLAAKPQTFMNLSGDSVGGLARYYKIPPERIVIIHDELDFDVGTVRVKSGGGHGGHNGMRSVMAHCSPEVQRIRVGIGRPAGGKSGADFVLSAFSVAERLAVEDAIDQAISALEIMLTDGVQRAMSCFNRRVPASASS